MRIGLIDGDIFAYRYAFSNQQIFDFGAGGIGEYTDMSQAVRDIDQSLRVIADEIKADGLIICLTGAKNFRKRINPSYKANRKKNVPPTLLADVRQYFLEEYQCEIWPDCEADDVMGVLQTRPGKDKTIIVSTDKDMLTIPGSLYNPMHNTKTVVKPEEALYAFYTQVLTGDAVDGYSGVPGIGPKRAEKILRPWLEAEGSSEDLGLRLWAACLDTFHDRGLKTREAIMQARMARILTWELWDEERQKVKLWEPPVET